jgi:uncharacterized protein
MSEPEVSIAGMGTTLPPWSSGSSGSMRAAGADEDAVTLAVAAGLGALECAGEAPPVECVVLVTPDPPLLEGGNGPALLAGLGLSAGVEVVERIGGAPATLDALTSAAPGTLVIGADAGTAAGAVAAMVGRGPGVTVRLRTRVNRSLPVRARDRDGIEHDDGDPRLERERGARASLAAAGIDGDSPVIVGVDPKDVRALRGRPDVVVPTRGASAPLFAIAEVAAAGGCVVGVDQARVTAVDVSAGAVAVHREEPPPRPAPTTREYPGPELRIVLSAYDRAFDARLRWEAARCPSCATLSYPPRYRCLACGSEAPTEATPLPRDATIYTATTVHVPVPGLASPYSLAIAELGDTDVRLLVPVTGVTPGSVAIGDPGRLVFRRLSVRSGVPDYGYAFLPDEAARLDVAEAG